MIHKNKAVYHDPAGQRQPYGRRWYKRFLPRTLFGRSLLIILVPVLMLQIITTVVFIDRHWSKMTDRLSFAVAGEIAIIAEQFERDPDPERVKAIAGYVARNLDLLISFEKGGALQSSFNSEDATIVARTLARAMKEQVRRPFDVHVDVEEKWVEISVQLQNGILHVSTLERRLFSSSGYIFLLWVVVSSMILFAIALVFMRNQIRPIRRLAVAAERLGKGQDVLSFKPEGASEVRQAARAFLTMRDRIKRQISQRTAMLAGVSHDLRTPLTRLRLELAMLGDNESTRAMNDDIAAMEKMIEGYLHFAKGQGEEASRVYDLGTLLDKITNEFRRAGAQIHLYKDDELQVRMKPLMFERAMQNLVSNACKYADTVWISAHRLENHIQVVVEDDGPGIDTSQYEDVFKPFFRVDSSRNPATGGVGLGLPIAQDIIHAHGGRIWLDKSVHGGVCVALRIPL